MTRTYYGLSELDGYHSHEGELCVIVLSTYQYSTDHPENNVIYNIAIENDTYEDRDSKFVGASICRYVSSQYILNIEHTQYQYDKKGNPTNSAAIGTKLYLGTVLNATAAAGNVIPGTTNATVSTEAGTRASTVTTGTSVSYLTDGAYQTVINSMNVRDEFANNALRGIISKIPDVTSLSKSEISYYCEQAYRWAEYMMTSCANTRASYSGTSGTVNTNNTDTEQYLQELVNGISQSSQIGFTIQTDGSIKVNDTNSAAYANGATFNFKVESGLLSEINDSYEWFSHASTNVGQIITGWANQIGILKWSDLTNAGNSEKINNAHLNISSDNNVANKIPVINSGGVMEVGTCMDFHDLREDHTNASDYNTRLITGNPSLNNGKGNIVTLPNNSGTLALVENTVSTSTTWWGEIISNGKVEGDIKNARHIYMSGNLDIVGQSGTASTIGFSEPVTSPTSPSYRTLIGVNSLTPPQNAQSDWLPAVYINYGLRYERKLQLHGRKIEFIVQNNSPEAYDQNGLVAMTILGRESTGKEGYVGIGTNTPTSKLHVNGAVRIGDILLTSEGSKLKISRYDGTAADVYSTGGVTALGIPSSNSGTVDNVSTKQLNVVGNNNTAKLFVEGSELRVTINNTTYRVNLTQIS